MKKLLLTLLLAVSVLSSTFARANAPEQKHDIVILFTNDVHCGVEEGIGYAGVSAYKAEAKAATPYVTLVDAGDAVQGDFIGTISKGINIIAIMNKIGYDVAVPGNHEFDYGMEQFMQFSKELNCGYIAANFRYSPTGRLVLPPYKIISCGKKKVAYVGVATPDSFITSTPSSFKDKDGNFIYDFGGENNGKPMFDDVQTAIDQAKKEGADYVVLVAHLGEHGKIDKWNAMNLVANIQGADILIDGHSHEVTPSLIVKDKAGKDITIIQAGTKLSHLGKITITPKGTITAELIDKPHPSPDASTTQFIADIKEEYTKALAMPLGTLDFPLVATTETGSWLVRNGETNLGDFTTDAIRSYYGTDIAVINGGGLRATIPAGTVTYSEVIKSFPFGNMLCVGEISGQTLLDELEFGASKLPNNYGGFLQVSGLTFTVDTTIPASVQTDENIFFTGVTGPYRVQNVMVNGKPLNLEKKYSVASLSYVLQEHGDGHRFEGISFFPVNTIFDRDAIAVYIEKLGKIPAEYSNPQGQGRIRIKK